MRLRLTAIERYVLVQTLTAVVGATAIIGSVVLLIDFVELSRQIGGRPEVSFLSIIQLTAMKSPSVIVILLPFMFLFGTLAAFVGLNRRSELVAMRAAGVSAWRFIMPAAAAAFAIGMLTVGALNPLTSHLADQFERTREILLNGQPAVSREEVWLRQGDEASQIVIHALGRDNGEVVRLRDVTFFIYTLRQDGVMTFTRRIDAKTATLRVGYWSLADVRESVPGGAAQPYDNLSIPTRIESRREVESLASPTAISFWRLPRVIAQTEQAGFSSAGYRLRLQQLIAMPLLFAAMSILAAAFSLRLMRLGGLAALATSGVALGFVFFFLNEFSGALGEAGVIPHLAAAWAPPALALLSGLTLLCYTEDG
jgi:lipopolysaccharide export system permease protein